VSQNSVFRMCQCQICAFVSACMVTSVTLVSEFLAIPCTSADHKTPHVNKTPSEVAGVVESWIEETRRKENFSRELQIFIMLHVPVDRWMVVNTYRSMACLRRHARHVLSQICMQKLTFAPKAREFRLAGPVSAV